MNSVPDIFCYTCGSDVVEDNEGALNCRCIDQFGVYVVIPSWGTAPEALDILTLADMSSNICLLDRNAKAAIRYRDGVVTGFNLTDQEAS